MSERENLFGPIHEGMRAEPAPSRYEHAVRLAEETVPAARWAAVRPGLDG